MQTIRLMVVRDGDPSPSITAPDGAVAELRERLHGLDREHFVALLLDCRNRPIGFHTVSIGTASASLVHPREVFKAAILANAASLIVAHNHPSGDTTPSREDSEITQRLSHAGKIIGIDVIDSIIVTDDGYLSFKERGLMP